MKNHKIGLLIALLAFTSRLPAQSLKVDSHKLDSLLTELYNSRQDMGTLTLMQHGKVIYSKSTGFGLINGKDSVWANAQTGYRIGSISKLYTAVMIFQLIDENKLQLNTTLAQYFPQVPNATKITIGNLLNHHGGLSDLKSIPDFGHWITQAHTEDEIIKVIAQSHIDFEPGTQAAYSNSGFILLSYILEKITGKPYSELLHERVTGKLGIKNTYYAKVRNTRPNESYSFHYDYGWQPVPETDWSIPNGAGGIISTTDEMDEFITGLFAGKLISSKSLNQMKTITDDYGMDMVLMPGPKQPAYGHTGGMDGFFSTLMYVPTDGLALAYCTNGQVLKMDQVIAKILQLIYPMDTYSF